MTAPNFAEFLAEDFDRFAADLLPRFAPLDGQRLYLSGATGFFGKSLLALLAWLQLRGLRFEVGALSRDPPGFFAREPWAARQGWLKLAGGDASAIWPGHGRYSLLIHAATDAHAGAHLDAQRTFDGMLACTRQALAFAESHGVRRLLLTGSGAQYAPLPPGAGSSLRENDLSACNPALPTAASAYGEAKRVAELLAALQAHRLGTAAVHTRCFTFVGPGLPTNGHFAIGNFLRDALAGTSIKLRSGGEAQRSYLYGADLAVWLLLLLIEAPDGWQVNVGSDEAVSVLALAQRVRDLLAPNLPVMAGSTPPGELRLRYLPDITRARSMGLEVWTSLDAAILRTATWHRLHAG